MDLSESNGCKYRIIVENNFVAITKIVDSVRSGIEEPTGAVVYMS